MHDRASPDNETAPVALRARYVPLGGRPALVAVPLVAVVGWGVWHVVSLTTAWRGTDGHGPTLVWLASFLLLWWLPLCWLERPFRAESDEAHYLDGLTVTVQIPVYNEDPQALRSCLESVLAQARPVQRVRGVDDGSRDHATGEPVLYTNVRQNFLRRAEQLGIDATWSRTPNRGKRWAQMHVLAEDDADIFVTLDSDSVLDPEAVSEGLKPFADPRVTSVAALVVVLNSRRNLLTRMSSVLYLPFTRGVRSAQSILGSVLINSGTLAFYRAEIVRKHAGVYERETFRGVPMQMNDNSMLTMYARLDGRTVHQPSSIVFTLAPERVRHYLDQQLRWMRGTTVRHLWWFRHMSLRSSAFRLPILEYTHMLLAASLPLIILLDPGLRAQLHTFAVDALTIGMAMNYLICLRLFCVWRTDEPRRVHWLLFLLSPLAGLWRLIVLRPLYWYAMATCWRIGSWGTRDRVEVRATEPAHVASACRPGEPSNRELTDPPTPVCGPER